MDVNFKVVAGAEDIFAEEIFGPGFGQGAIENARAFGHFAANVDVGQVNVVREAGDDHALQQLVRVADR